MKVELNLLRERFGRLLVVLFWAHVPILGLAALWHHRMAPASAMLAGAAIALTYQLIRHFYGTSPPARHASAVLLIAEPSLLLLLFAGDPWQMDMHMYFFAILALIIAWFDRTTILLASVLTGLHHLVLVYLLPRAVFPGEGDLSRVALHAVIVLFQGAVLIWVSNMVVRSFTHIGRISDALVEQSQALEERTREAEEASRAKSLFLANMSHEIRTPINAILGFCHLVQRTPLDPRQRDYVGKINGAGVSLLRLISDILDFSKIEVNRLTLESHAFDLRAAIAGQIQLVSESIRAKNLRIEMHVDDDVPSLLMGDELRLNQVVLNLLGNAIKFSSRGTITIRVSLAGMDEGRAAIQCSVSDNGIGMTAEQVARLFTSFAQADPSTTRRFGGTGLGLAISRQIVEQMDGWIKAESLPDVGSLFTFLVRLEIGQSAPVEPAEPSDELRRLRVLVADDNVATLQIIGELFQRWHMQVDLVASGPEALAMAEREAQAGRPYDLLLIDWKMPGIDGLQAVRDMRASARIDQPPEVVIMTAYDIAEVVQAAIGDDIRAFICKPVTAQNLLQALGRVRPQPALAALPEVPQLPQLPPALCRRRVLLVEDNDINREIALELLTDAGLMVDYAVNGAIACDKVAQSGGDYAAILMDVQMPEMDGIAATREIRRHHGPDTLPIIAMTAHAYAEEKQRCLDAGMNDHLAKPVDPMRLVQVLHHWLSLGLPVAAAPLPEALPPFDLEAALRRVNGKADLLRRLIVDFGAAHAGTAEQLADLLLEGRIEEAHRLAHSLKGVAASLELAEVAEIAADIETRLAAHARDGFEPALEALARALEPAIRAARLLDENRPAATAPRPVASRQTRLSACATLRRQIERRSLSARDGYAVLADALGLSSAAREADPLHRALLCFDYDIALALLDRLEADQQTGEAA